MNNLSDFISRINNVIKLRRTFVKVKRSNFCLEVLRVLRNEGFIIGFHISDTNINEVFVFLKYFNNVSLIKNLTVKSTSSRVVFVNNYLINKSNISRSSYFIMSTNRGIVSSNFLSKHNLKLSGILLFVIDLNVNI